MMSNDELAALQAYAESSLTDTCEIERATLADDGMLGSTTTMTPVATVPCRAAPLGAGAQSVFAAIGGSLGVGDGYTVTVPYGTDLQATDVITWQGVPLVAVRVLSRSYQTALQALARRED